MCLHSFVWVKLIVSFTNDGATELNYNSGLYNKQWGFTYSSESFKIRIRITDIHLFHTAPIEEKYFYTLFFFKYIYYFNLLLE